MTPTGINLVTVEPRDLKPWERTWLEEHRGYVQRMWHYSPTQQSRRIWIPDQRRKAVKPFIGSPDLPWDKWVSKAGEDKWPHYFTHQPEESWRDCWILETEGEKCSDVCASAGYAAISQPGFNRGADRARHRYRTLRGKVQGVVYLSDAVDGLGVAKELEQAAAAVGLPFVLVDMGALFADLPKGGSIDDLPDPKAAIAKIQAWAQQQLATLQAVSEPEPEAPPPSQVALPADETTGREEFTFDRLVPSELGDALGFLTEALPADPLTVVLTFLAHLSGLLRIGNRVASAADYSVPMNLFLCLVGKTGCGKSPLLDECARRPAAGIIAAERADWKTRKRYWELTPKKEREDKPPQRIFSLLTGYTPAALDQQLAEHEAQGKGLLLVRDELSGLFASLAMDAKSGSGKGDSQLLELWDGTGRADILVDSFRAYEVCHFSMVGPIQPLALKQFIKGSDPTGKWARNLFCFIPPGFITPSLEAPSQSALRRRDQARERLAHYAINANRVQPKTYFLGEEARIKFRPWFIDHQKKAQLDSTDPLVAAMRDKSSAQFLRLAGLLHMVRHLPKEEPDPEEAINLPAEISLDTAELAMQIVDQLFAETERFHRGDADVVDQLMDRIRATKGEVSWKLMRAKRLDRFLKANARVEHFEQAVQNLLDNNEGELTRQKPVIWRK